MNSSELFNSALNHIETGKIPLDIGGSVVTSIAVTAYKRLRKKLGLQIKRISIQNLYSMSARLDEDVLDMLDIDTRFFNENPYVKQPDIIVKDRHIFYTDSWGFKYAKNKNSDSGFSVIKNPLADAEKVSDILDYNWQEPLGSIDLGWLKKRAKYLKEEKNFPVILESDIGGVFEFPSWLRSPENFYMDMAMQPKMAETIIDKTVQVKLKYYNNVLKVIGKYIDIVRESDDLAGQNGLLISKETYRKFIKPAHKKIFSSIKKNCNAKICLHSCGSIRELIPDFIESGVEVLNPIQTSADNMELKGLKRDFGKDIVFWGAGCDSQYVLPMVSPRKVREEVQKTIDILAPDGGFICAPINMIQSDVPPENIIAFINAVRGKNI